MTSPEHKSAGEQRFTRCLQLAAASFVITLSPVAAQNETAYPAKNIRLIVPSPAGGPSDIVARLLGDKVGASLGKQVIIDNRIGAGQIMGSNIVATADPDGYTLLQAAANISTNPVTIPHLLPYDAVKDFAPVSMTHVTPYVFVVSARSPVKTLPELLTFIRSNPEKISYGSTGAGGPHHLATLLMIQLAGGISGMTEVNYKGSAPAHPDLIANRITFMIDPLAAASPHIKSGLLRALAVSTPQRNPAFPDVPAAAEILSGYDFASWGGVFAPAGTPRAIVMKLNAAIGAALAAPDITERFADLGLMPKHSTPEALGEFLQAEINRWRALLAKPPS